MGRLVRSISCWAAAGRIVTLSPKHTETSVDVALKWFISISPFTINQLVLRPDCSQVVVSYCPFVDDFPFFDDALIPTEQGHTDPECPVVWADIV